MEEIVDAVTGIGKLHIGVGISTMHLLFQFNSNTAGRRRRRVRASDHAITIEGLSHHTVTTVFEAGRLAVHWRNLRHIALLRLMDISRILFVCQLHIFLYSIYSVLANFVYYNLMVRGATRSRIIMLQATAFANTAIG